jgi:hypothetical protein
MTYEQSMEGFEGTMPVLETRLQAVFFTNEGPRSFDGSTKKCTWHLYQKRSPNLEKVEQICILRFPPGTVQKTSRKERSLLRTCSSTLRRGISSHKIVYCHCFETMPGEVTPSGVQDSQDCVVWPTQKGPGLLGVTSRRSSCSSESSGSTTTLGDGTSKRGGVSQPEGLSQWENLNEDNEDDDEDEGFLGLLDQHGNPIPDPNEFEKENDKPVLTSNDSNKARWPPVNVLVKNSSHVEFLLSY